MRQQHGGDIYGEKKIRLDFSVNTNPLGMPETVRACGSRQPQISRPCSTVIRKRESLCLPPPFSLETGLRISCTAWSLHCGPGERCWRPLLFRNMRRRWRQWEQK